MKRIDLTNQYRQSDSNTSSSNPWNIDIDSLNDGFLELTDSEKTQVEYIKNNIASEKANWIISSIDKNWTEKNNLDKRIINQLNRININEIIWKLRYYSSLDGIAFVLPQVVNDNLNLYVVPKNDTMNYQFINNYLLSFSGKVEVLSGSNVIEYNYVSNDNQLGYTVLIKDDNNEYIKVPNNYPFNVKNTFNNTKLFPAFLIKNNPNTDSDFTNAIQYVNTKAHYEKKLVDDIDYSANAVQIFVDKGKRNIKNLIEFFAKMRRRSNQIIDDSNYNFNSRASVGKYSQQAGISQNAYITNALNYNDYELRKSTKSFLSQGSKKGANQLTTEIITENINALNDIKNFIFNLEGVLINIINYLYQAKGITRSINSLDLGYSLYLIEVIKQINENPNTPNTNGMNNGDISGTE